MRPRRASVALLLLAIATAWPGLLAGCGDYEVQPCDPGVSSLTDDVCNRLNVEGSCTPYQCDSATRRCVLRPRDFDRDGDPDVACGGRDCDDLDAQMSSLRAWDAEQIQDIGLPGSVSESDVAMASANGADLVGAFVTGVLQGGCLQLVKLSGSSPGYSYQGACPFASADAASALPRQPQARRAGDFWLAAFVATQDCGAGMLGYRVSDGSKKGAAGIDCPGAAPGVALPAVAPFGGEPSKASALVAWYRVDLAERESHVAGCADAKPAPLQVAVVAGATSGKPTLGQPVELDPAATSVRAPALLSVSSPRAVLVASPSGEGLGLWLVGADGGPGTMDATWKTKAETFAIPTDPCWGQ